MLRTLVFAGLMFASPVFAIAPTQRAEQIALSSPLARMHWNELHVEARRIRDPLLRETSLEILEKPKFQLAEKRRGDSQKIRAKLLELGLLDPKTEPKELIPNHEPMPFVAAPASFWTQHHTYPGGLVFHTLTNLRTGTFIAQNWFWIYHVRLNSDLIRAATIWHDSAKTWTLEWQPDGTVSRSEGQIAGTGAHHVLAVAEAVLRGMPAEFVVTLASAHNPAHPGAGLEELISYLKAASILAGKGYSSAGLSEDGTRLAAPAPLESYVNHLSDHDWVVTEVSLARTREALQALSPAPTAWEMDELFATYGDLKVYQEFLFKGSEGLKVLLAK